MNIRIPDDAIPTGSLVGVEEKSSCIIGILKKYYTNVASVDFLCAYIYPLDGSTEYFKVAQYKELILIKENYVR